jgi:hypothetical protein
MSSVPLVYFGASGLGNTGHVPKSGLHAFVSRPGEQDWSPYPNKTVHCLLWLHMIISLSSLCSLLMSSLRCISLTC